MCVKEWVYMIVEDLTLHCFSTSTENLEQAMQVSGWGGLCGACVHAVGLPLLHTDLVPPSGE